MSSSPDPLIGKSVSHYSVVRRLGSGGMGVVYEAEDSRLGRNVALKFLPPELARDGSSLERFQREARAASALNHPGICTVFAIEEHEGQHFIVMECLEGQTLAQMMAARGAFDLENVLSIGVQIADALESAHARGIVHRDVKPANVFVNGRGQVKILDFGLARIDGPGRGRDGAVSRLETVGDLTTPGTAMGTVSYMSPEQARGQLADARTDLFSLGTVLYEMATGTLPFPGETSAVVFDAILNRDPRSAADVNSALPPELSRILDKALEKDRNLRYQTATDLKTDLSRLRRDMDSGRKRAAEKADSRGGGGTRQVEKSIAVLYFENLSGVKEDEYFRDGITEDIITELSKIKGLNIFSRPTVLAWRDKTVTPAQIGQQLNAAYVLAGSLRRAGTRLRINAQLVDTKTDFPLWSDRYDRQMEDVFELQDEIARKIAEALRVTLSPQEEAALASKPTENLQAYDLYLRGKSYARRLTRQDNEFALQMFENAVALDPGFALAHAAIANVCAQTHYSYGRDPGWLERGARRPQGRRAPSRAARARRRARGASTRTAGTTTPSRPCARRSRGRATARARTTSSGARSSRRAATRSSRTSPRRRWRRAGRTTTSSSRSRTRSARSGRRRLRNPSGSARSRRSRATSGPSRRTPAPASSSRATTPSRAGPRTRSARRTSPSPCARTKPRSSTTRRASSAASRTSRRRSTR